MKKVLDWISPKSALRGTLVSVRPLGWILSGSVLALLFLGQSFGTSCWRVPPGGQPSQMWSRVNYDSNLNDPFFESNNWICPDVGKVACNGMAPEREAPHPLKGAAMCFSNSMGAKHLVEFCEAKVVHENAIDLFIHHTGPAYADRLRVRIRNGMFTSQYWTLFKVGTATGLGATWTTKRQKLTVGKRIYQKGDVIKGRIDVECVQEMTNAVALRHYSRKQKTIYVFGVFTTIVE